MTRKTKRIYYGPDTNPTACWWDVEWSPAKKTVTINGTLEHCIQGRAGHSIGCRLSNAATDVDNASAFPHPAYIAAFYKSQALIVDKLAKNGTPAHAIVYEHSYGDYIDMNDASSMEEIYKDKRFVLRPPAAKKTSKPQESDEQSWADDEQSWADKDSQPQQDSSEMKEKTNPAQAFSPSSAPVRKAAFRGAMGRAVKSGLLGKPAADQLTRGIKKIHG